MICPVLDCIKRSQIAGAGRRRLNIYRLREITVRLLREGEFERLEPAAISRTDSSRLCDSYSRYGGILMGFIGEVFSRSLEAVQLQNSRLRLIVGHVGTNRSLIPVRLFNAQ